MSPKVRVTFELILFSIAHLACLFFFVTQDVSAWEIVGSIAVSFFILVLGQEIGAHRLFAHHSFSCSKPSRILIHFVLTIANYGSSLDWNYIHNIHHKYCDTENDPTSPSRFSALTLFSNYWKWLFVKQADSLTKVPGLKALRKQPEALFFHKYHEMIVISWNLFLLLFFSLKGVVLFSFVPMLFVSYALNSVNYFCHLGEAEAESPCRAQNVGWINYYMFGSGWHATHHHSPAKHRFSPKNDAVAWLIEKLFATKQEPQTYE